MRCGCCFHRLQHRQKTDKANKNHSEPELNNLRLSISVFYTSPAEDKSGEMIAKDEVFGIQTFNLPLMTLRNRQLDTKITQNSLRRAILVIFV